MKSRMQRRGRSCGVFQVQDVQLERGKNMTSSRGELEKGNLELNVLFKISFQRPGVAGNVLQTPSGCIH